MSRHPRSPTIVLIVLGRREPDIPRPRDRTPVSSRSRVQIGSCPALAAFS
jgi:hypothetical protein